jgi:alpha-tubulin suppressor-like RCC1 family protein
VIVVAAFAAAISVCTAAPGGASVASHENISTSSGESPVAPGNAWTWGADEGSSPVQLAVSNVTDTQAGHWGGMAVSAGNVYQWLNTDDSDVTEVAGLPSDVVSLGEASANQSSEAVTSDGELWTWGLDQYGQTCNGRREQDAPVTRIKASDVVESSGGAGKMVFLRNDGSVWACGQNTLGELGDGKTASSLSPVKVMFPKGTDIVAISSGNTFTIAIDSTGNVWAWGQDQFGQLGQGTTSKYSDVPVVVQGLPAAAEQVYAGGSTKQNGQALALLSNGQVWAWGNDSWGQLGNGTKKKAVPTPVEASALPEGVTWTQVATGGQDAFAIDSMGSLWAWGAPPQSTSSYSLTPNVVESGVEQVSATAGVVTTVVTSS